MSLHRADTIVALATAPLAAGVAVLRLSGPGAVAAVAALHVPFATAEPRTLVYGTLTWQGEPLDHALMARFEAPHSFTGEHVAEVHTHGGRAVVQAVLSALLAQPGVRLAEPGEFSRRAFINGKLDLTEAEGLADLIAADTEAQRRQALRQLDGELGTRFEQWRSDILHLLAHVEAAIDFPDEELDVLEDARLAEGLDRLIATFDTALATTAGDRVRDGFRVVIVGRPNAGKSTLTNLLTGRDTAIVSPIAGTTRDVVEAVLNLNGFPVVLADTAGLRATADSIEAEGVRRAKAHAAKADVVVLVVDAAEFPALDPEAAAALRPGASLIVVSKADTPPGVAFPPHLNGTPVLAADLTAPDAGPRLVAALADTVAQLYAPAREAALLTRTRHRQLVEQARGHLMRARAVLTQPSTASLSDLMAQDLRDAAKTIGHVTGRTGAEDVLDVVFSTFCVGK